MSYCSALARTSMVFTVTFLSRIGLKDNQLFHSMEQIHCNTWERGMANTQNSLFPVMLSAAKNLYLAGDRLGRSFLRCAQHDSRRGCVKREDITNYTGIEKNYG